MLSLSIAIEGRKVNWPQQSGSIKLYCKSHFAFAADFTRGGRGYHFRGQYISCAFVHLKRDECRIDSAVVGRGKYEEENQQLIDAANARQEAQ